MGTFIWTNFLRDILPITTKVYSMPDSGFFLDFYGPGSNLYKTIISLAGVSITSNDMIEPKGCPYLDDPDTVY
jgi:hypothetical protein